MRTSEPTLRRCGSRRILSSLVLLAWMLSYTGISYANGTPPPPPPPPPATPTDTPRPTDTPEPTDTAEATETPEPTDTSKPTNTPKPPATPQATDTIMPTATSEPTDAASPGQPAPSEGQTEELTNRSDCQSSVQGAVSDSSGQEARGATVIIEGEAWSDSILTNDSGQYGFAGLCAGTVTLTAYLADGQVSQRAHIPLNGRDSVQVDLSTALTQATVAATAVIAQQTATPEPGLPATGYPGWVLAGAVLLGLTLLLPAGILRVLRERTQDHK
jgi:hypothetical protein